MTPTLQERRGWMPRTRSRIVTYSAVKGEGTQTLLCAPHPTSVDYCCYTAGATAKFGMFIAPTFADGSLLTLLTQNVVSTHPTVRLVHNYDQGPTTAHTSELWEGGSARAVEDSFWRHGVTRSATIPLQCSAFSIVLTLQSADCDDVVHTTTRCSQSQ
jgi:hypothetical protein